MRRVVVTGMGLVTPLGGDVIAIRLVVEPGARLRLRSAAASLALPGPGTRNSHSCWTIEVAMVRDSLLGRANGPEVPRIQMGIRQQETAEVLSSQR